MSDVKTFVVTRDWIKQWSNSVCCIRKSQAEAIGADWLVKGWLDRVEGENITTRQARAFELLSGKIDAVEIYYRREVDAQVDHSILREYSREYRRKCLMCEHGLDAFAGWKL